MTQPPTNFSYCNPLKNRLHLVCRVLVPRDSTTVTVDWYWSKNINECGKNITEEQGRFTINTNRGYAPQFNSDRINSDLTIEYPERDTGYYWCQVNDPSYNGVFISSNKAPVFDTGTMTTCSGTQSVIMTTCAITSNINTLSFLMCFISTQTVSPSMLTSRYSETAMSISDIKSISSTMTITVTVMSGTTSRKSSKTLRGLSSSQTDHLLYSTSTEMYKTTSLITTDIILTTTSTSDIKTVTDTTLNFKSSTVTDHDSTSTEMYPTTSLLTSSNLVKHTSDIFSSHESSTTTEHSLQLPVYLSSSCVIHIYTNCSNYSNDNNIIGLISGLFALSIVMFGLGGVLCGLLTVLWKKKRKRKGRLKVIIYYYLICYKLIDTEIQSPISKGMRSVV